jgi:hypothetical protein
MPLSARPGGAMSLPGSTIVGALRRGWVGKIDAGLGQGCIVPGLLPAARCWRVRVPVPGFRATPEASLMAVWPDDGCASNALPQLLRLGLSSPGLRPFLARQESPSSQSSALLRAELRRHRNRPLDAIEAAWGGPRMKD